MPDAQHTYTVALHHDSSLGSTGFLLYLTYLHVKVVVAITQPNVHASASKSIKCHINVQCYCKRGA